MGRLFKKKKQLTNIENAIRDITNKVYQINESAEEMKLYLKNHETKEKSIEKLEAECKSFRGKAGGYKKTINKLQNELIEKNKIIEELKEKSANHKKQNCCRRGKK